MSRACAVARYAKAVVAGVVSGLGALQVALPNGITGQEGIGIALAVIAGTGIVAGTPNARRRR